MFNKVDIENIERVIRDQKVEKAIYGGIVVSCSTNDEFGSAMEYECGHCETPLSCKIDNSKYLDRQISVCPNCGSKRTISTIHIKNN